MEILYRLINIDFSGRIEAVAPDKGVAWKPNGQRNENRVVCHLFLSMQKIAIKCIVLLMDLPSALFFGHGAQGTHEG